MAQFIIENLKEGIETSSGLYTYHLTLTNIIWEEGDEVVVLPDKYEGKVITHFGYKQGYTPAEERWHDWHHPSQGMEYIPARFDLERSICTPPPHVKKVIFPRTAKDIFTNIFNTEYPLDGSNKYRVIIEIDPLCNNYYVYDNVIKYRKQ
ncbi:MAG: hypothetical protein IKD45_05495 [Clostridia bacterium]|nr:hypothetical protein [Clostridia bacterium]